MCAGGALLCSNAAMAAVTAVAGAAGSKQHGAASELASYTVRLQLLQVALQQSARAVLSSSTTQSTENKGEDCRAW